MLIIKMAFRNVFRQKRRSALTAMMIISGFVLFSFSVGLSDGSYGSIIDMFTGDHTGHVQIHKKGYLEEPSLYDTIDKPSIAKEKILTLKQVKAVAPRVYSPCLALFGSKTMGAKIIGADPGLERNATKMLTSISSGKPLLDAPSDSIVISKGLSDVLKIKPGDQIALISQAGDGSIANKLFDVIGIAGGQDSTAVSMNCYMHIKTAQDFLVIDGKVHELAIKLKKQELAKKTAAEINSILNNPAITAEPWQVVEEQFYKAMMADRKGNYVSQFIIMLIVAIGILNTVLMSILERTREFGVMRAIGTRPSSIFTLIICETFFLTLMSLVFGILISLALNYYFSIHGIQFSPPIEFGGVTCDVMSSRITWKTLWLPGSVTLFTALFVSIFPAIRAARIIPVKAMKAD